MDKTEEFNPFFIKGYVTPKYFCDRKNELKWMNDNITNNRNMVIYAWRRLGKTSLIHHFRQQKAQQKAECIFVDLLATENSQEAITRITNAIVEKYGNLEKGFTARLRQLITSIGATISFDPETGLPKIKISYEQPPKPEYSLEQVGKFLSESKKQVIIALDEFQQITHYPEKNTEAVFRTWMQQFNNLHFIFSGSHRHMMVSMFSETARPFYHSAQLMELKPIDESIYEKFITEKFEEAGKTIDPEVIRAIFKWSRGQTYFIQLVCNKLFATSNVATLHNFRDATTGLIAQNASFLANYQQLLTATQWSVLKAIARHEPVNNAMSQEFARANHLGATSSIRTAIKALVEKEVVIQEPEGYMVHDTLMSRWLQTL